MDDRGILVEHGGASELWNWEVDYMGRTIGCGYERTADLAWAAARKTKQEAADQRAKSMQGIRLQWCSGCRFFLGFEAKEDGTVVGVCRRHAPVLDKNGSGFPHTNDKGWCGEWEPKR